MTTADFSLLPPGVRPLTYRITLAPSLESFTFRGEEAIDMDLEWPVSEVVLNAAEIQVESAQAVPDGGGVLEAERILYDEAAQTVTLGFGSSLPAGRARLEIRFSGQLNERLHGFYRSRYQTAGGEERSLAVTQFEPTDARRAFPCFDEPALKATFQVSLDIPSHLTVVSNTLAASESLTEPGTKRVTFAETPRMSTYLLAFIVGELESIEATASDGTLVRVWTTSGKAEQGRFALETSVRLLSFFNDYFGIPYPLEKLDHIALPDFAAGAMENWGAVTYRETALLVDPENSAAGTRQRVAEVVAHEMAHMWFGDLVTMQWWNDLWLNESFASWMGDKAVNHLFPDWDMWTQFIVNDTNAGLNLDGLKNSHPIEATVRDPAEVQQLFDAISYSKGASIIRMLEHFIGEEPFREGLRSYLSAHMYGNARTADLWQAMEEASQQPVIAMMGSWIGQMGYPVLQAEVHRAVGQVEVRLSQTRFLYDQGPDGEEQDTTLWQVPITSIGQGASGTDRLLLSSRDGNLRLERALPPSQAEGWVKVNASQMGFYRVNYPAEEWARLLPAIEAQELTPADRLGLQSDAYALARAGLLPATQYLALAQAFKGEQVYPLWSDLSINLRQMEALLAQEEFLPRFLAFGRDLFLPIARQVGWEPEPGEGHLRVLLRSTVLGQHGGYGDASILEEARRRFTRFQEDPSFLAPDLRAVVYALAAQTGDETTHDALRELARRATLHEEKLRLLLSLARFSRRDLLQRTLELSLSAEVRAQDTVILVTAVAANREGRDLAWAFVKDRWAEFDERYGSGGFALMRLVAITGSFTRLEDRQDVEEFFQTHPVPAAARTVQQSLERIALNARWLERNRSDLARYLDGLRLEG